MKVETFVLSISASPSVIKFSDLDDFRISISATNQNSKTIKPELQMTDLYINEVKSMTWMLAISNGIRESKLFSALMGL